MAFTGVFGQHFDISGTPLGTEFQVNTYTPGFQDNPGHRRCGAGLRRGLAEQVEDGYGDGIFGQRFVTSCGDGVVGPGEQCDPPNGTTCSSGCAFPTPTPADTPTPTATFGALGAEFQANTYTPLNYQLNPAVAGDPAGNFVIVWDSMGDGTQGQDGYGAGVFGQRYDSSGAMAGTEFQVNTYTPGYQYFSRVAVSPGSGNFLVVWEDKGPFLAAGLDGDSSGIFGQRFDSGGTALGAQFQVNTYTGGSEAFPDVGADMNGNFVVVWQQYPVLDGAATASSASGSTARAAPWARSSRSTPTRRATSAIRPSRRTTAATSSSCGRIGTGRTARLRDLRAALRQRRLDAGHRVPGQHPDGGETGDGEGRARSVQRRLRRRLAQLRL